MSFRGADRGVVVQVGMAILLAFLVLTLAIYQAEVIPDQNKGIEYNHNQDVQSDLQDVRSAIVSIPGDGNARSVSVKLGTTYPSRALFVNPPASTGQIRTAPPGRLSVANAETTGETGDFWNGTRRDYTTRAVVYRPNYNEYDQAPTTFYENTVLANAHSNGATTLQSGQRLVDDRTITVVTVNGSYQKATTSAVSLDLRAASSSENTVTVTDDGTGPVTITAPTLLDNSTWADLLESEYVANGGHVVGHEVTSVPGEEFDRLRIALEPGTTYELRMARVGVGTNVANKEAAYITDVEGDGETIDTGENHTLVAEVRDRLNNPVSGQVVNASVVSGPGSVTPANDTSDADGRVEYTYGSSTSGTAKINVSFGPSPGEAETATFTVTVSSDGGGGNSAPTARFTHRCSALTCTFNASDSSDSDGNITSYDWEFGDGTNGTGEVVNHTYNSSGTYTVNLTVTDDDGATDTESKTITVGSNSPPTANFTYSPSSPLTGETVTFDGSGSSDPDGSIVSYEWDFGDGNVTTDGATINHTYSDDGDYNVTLTVTDDDGATASETQTVSVQNRAPTADLTANRTSVLTDEPIEFDASGSSDPDGTIAEYRWDFDGDGSVDTTTSDPTVVHSYADDGTYDATVTVVDDDGATDSDSVTITVDNRAPTANLTANRTTVLTDETVEFDASNSSDPDGTIAQYYWDFDGDGTNETTTSDPTVNHSYADNGTYDATVTVEDDDGATDADSVTITVQNRAPTANFTYSCDGLTCTFNDTSSDADGSVVAWSWELGDGNTSTSQNVTHTYSSAGNYTVNLTVTDDDGATGSENSSFTVVVYTYVDEFDDVATPTSEPGENKSIPPSSAEGDLEQFSNLQAADGSTGTLSELLSQCILFCFNFKYNLNVGLATRNVPDGSTQQVTIKYRTNATSGDAEDLSFDVVDASGNDVDGATSYSLPSTAAGTNNTVTVTLSAAETQAVNNSGDLYLIVEDVTPDDDFETIVDVFFVRVETSD